MVRGLIIACLIVFALQFSGSGGQWLLFQFALWPPLPAGLAEQAQYAGWPELRPWQLLSYAFLHGGPFHLLFNLFGLWMFGQPVERAIGSRRFALFYFVCVVGAAIAQIFAAKAGGTAAPTIGASGGVMGLLPAFAVLFPRARVQLLFPPIPMRAPVFVLLYGAAELYFGMTNTLPGIAHFAHLGGMVGGMMLLGYWLLTAGTRRRSPPDAD